MLGRRVRSWCEGEPGYAATHAHRYTRKEPNLHRVIWFMQEAGDGQLVEFGLLRSLLWMEENGAYQEGNRVAIDQPEMGVPGLGQILRIDRCPDLEEGPGCLVTGWYRHSHGEIWEVVLEGGETIETTAQHPFWSADRLAFVPACELRPGEHLSGRAGQVRVLSVRKRDGIETVYNIEVESDHCYRVGEQGVLVHNASAVYRGMTEASTGLPQAGPTARQLGVRPGSDVTAVNDTDEVDPDDGGMSVAPGDPTNLPSHRRPPALGGTGKDPVWAIDPSNLGPKLKYRKDNSKHGTVLPAKKMTLAEFQQALAETASKWTKVCGS